MLVRDLEEPSEKYGEDPWKRPIKDLLEKGIVVIDKPAGPTSHQVTAWAKQIVGARKAGHSGTLDPGVTGVLPIAFNSATKTVQAILKAAKEYIGVMYIHGDVDESDIQKVAKQFEGEIMQIPPAKSAVKRRSRKRTVYYFKVMEIQGREVLFRTSVEAGTYIRKLCHDMGVAFEVGANMKELRRTKAGPFTENTAVTLHQLKEAWEFYKLKEDESLLRKIIRPVEDGIFAVSKVYIKNSAVNSLTYGANLGVNGISKVEKTVEQGKMVAMLTAKGELVALGTALMDGEDMVKLWEGEAVKTNRVIIEKDRYPKTWKSKKPKKTRTK